MTHYGPKTIRLYDVKLDFNLKNDVILLLDALLRQGTED